MGTKEQKQKTNLQWFTLMGERRMVHILILRENGKRVQKGVCGTRNTSSIWIMVAACVCYGCLCVLETMNKIPHSVSPPQQLIYESTNLGI